MAQNRIHFVVEQLLNLQVQIFNGSNTDFRRIRGSSTTKKFSGPEKKCEITLKGVCECIPSVILRFDAFERISVDFLATTGKERLFEKNSLQRVFEPSKTPKKVFLRFRKFTNAYNAFFQILLSSGRNEVDLHFNKLLLKRIETQADGKDAKRRVR